MLDVSVIIPVYHDWDRLALCVRALEQQSYPKEHFEVIIVNNDPEDRLPNGYNIPSNFKVVDEQKRGSYAARNTGVTLAKGEVLAFTDSDCIPDSNWIKNAVDLFESNTDLQRIGGKVELFFRGIKPNLAEAYEQVYAFRQELYVKDGGAVTADMMARKALFDKVGLFNSDLYSGGDNEWGGRARAKGFDIVYAPNVVVQHPARTRTKELIQKAKRVSSGLNKSKQRGGFFKYKKLIRLLLIPPVGELRNIFTTHLNIGLSKKIAVFILRYYILLIRSYEVIRLHHGAKAFKDAY